MKTKSKINIQCVFELHRFINRRHKKNETIQLIKTKINKGMILKKIWVGKYILSVVYINEEISK